MVITSAREGFRAAWRHPALTALSWLWTLLLGATVAVPAWTWWYGATATAPDADLLLTRFSFGVVTELMRRDSPLSLLLPAFAVVAFLAFLGQALVAGGTIEVLTTDDARPWLHRFFRGAGHFFARFLRASVYGWLTFLLAWLVVSVIFGPIGDALEEMDWEPAWYLGWAARWLIVGLLAVYVSLAIDYARIRMAGDDSRRAFRAVFGGLWFVARRPKATFGVWFVMAAATVVVFAIYFAVCETLPSNTWGLIGLTLLVQQITMVARAWLRVALVGAEVGVWGRSSEFRVPSSGLGTVTPRPAELRTPEAGVLEIPHQPSDES